eukprot:TRINITY_DN14111_c1_g2_i1.p1 TRINITY_DN14111_c1_g2~~TRINITY_DN14111_c1_g2_i1.p1  ORF type:complete len:389 (-),score=62.17 TRINITY_DN14111_c1_g2_i1:36-1181(-)
MTTCRHLGRRAFAPLLRQANTTSCWHSDRQATAVSGCLMSMLGRRPAYSSSASTQMEGPEQIAHRLKEDHVLAARVAALMDPKQLVDMSHQAEAAIAETSGRSVERPSADQLVRLAIRQAVPFFGFGLFDNMVMITVGDAVDATFGVKLGISTLAAAGFGQMASDSVGITLQGVIERFADRLHLPDPGLSVAQEQTDLCKTVTQVARTAGILVGCFVGMFPLLLLENRDPRLVNQILELLPKEKQGEFWASLESMSYSEGDKILERGEEGKYLHLIVHGECDVMGVDPTGSQLHVCTLTAGSTVGELEFISGQACIADVIASSPVRTQRLEKSEFLRICGDEGISKFEEHLVDSRYVYYRMHECKDPGQHRMQAYLEHADA